MQDDKQGPSTPHAPAPRDGSSEVSLPEAEAAYTGEAGREAAIATTTALEPRPPATAAAGGGSRTPPQPPATEGDEDEEGMVRMSFLEHLEELRSRIIKALIGLVVSFAICIVFSNQLWVIVSHPAIAALKELGFQPKLAITRPMEAFSIVWVKLPMLASIFLASPWILYQVWGFIAPGLYKRERRWAAPFVICSAGLFIAGGLFAYFVAFRFGLTFLLGIGRGIDILPVVTISEYFDLFVNVTLGIGVTFELPVLIFFLTLLRIVSPSFLIRHSRYAILAITVLAAIITPTPDIFNMMMFVVPMLFLYFIGVFASYLLVLHREQRRFPWRKFLYVVGIVLFVIGGLVYFAITKYGYRPVPHWPFLVR